MLGWIRKVRLGGKASPAAADAGATEAGDAAARSQTLRIDGNRWLDAGQLERAAACYRQAVALDAASVAARVNLAYVLIEQQLPAEAEPHLQHAVALDGSNFDAFYMLGNAARLRGDPVIAAAHFERASELRPDVEVACADACQSLVALGEHERALAVVRRGLAASPQSADLHFLLGNLCLHAQSNEQAIEAYAATLALRPDHVAARSNTALALRALGRPEAAADCYAQALSSQPDAVELRYELALTLHSLGRGLEAIGQLQQVVALRLDHFDAHLNLGVVLQSRADLVAAIRSYRCALALKPDSAPALCNLGSALAAQGLREQAITYYERALLHEPRHARSQAALAVELHEMGRLSEAVAHLQQALALNPMDIEAHSSLLFLLSFAQTPAAYLDEARRYGAKLAARAKPLSAPVKQGSVADPACLRVGVVSGDLRLHPVALFLEAVLAQIDRNRVEVFAYVTRADEDAVTARLKRHCTGWASIVGLDDESAARRIHADRPHLLIDLAGHTAHNRLPVFAWKPAPVQVSWLGYFASTGVQAMDYLLADRAALPEPLRSQFTEQIWYLPHTRLCFSAPAEDPALQPSPPPANRNGCITFGSFQALSKLNDDVLRLWAQVLSAVAGSRLRLQANQLDRPAVRDRLLQRLVAAGLAAERVTLAPPTTREQYLAAYAEVDVVLDTFPYPGGTTTCEALWMGVPTLTMAGDTLLSRQGNAMLESVGLSDWVAADTADYLARAVRLVGDLEALACLRAGLRERAARSALFDAPRFARDFERALWGMWRQAALPRTPPEARTVL